MSLKKLFLASLCVAAVGAPAIAQEATGDSMAKHDWVYGVRYVGGRLVDAGGGDIWVEQAMVTTFIPENPSHPPIVMIPGLGLAGSMYTTTTDGKRKGWAQIFAEAGYPVYVYDLPEYSTSGGFDPSLFSRILDPLQTNARNFGNPYATAADTPCKMMAPAGMGGGGMAAGGDAAAEVEVCPEPLAMDVSAPSFAIYAQANLRAWVGLENGEAWSGTKFPMDDYSIAQFEKSFPYRWNDNGIEGADEAPVTGNVEAEALVALYEEIGEPFIIMAHSAGNGNVEPLLDAKPEAVRALVGYEPAFLFRSPAEEFAQKLKGKPYLSLYGDNVQARGHGGRYESNLVELVPAVAATGTPAGAIDLPALGITGNSHMLAQDTNNVEIAHLVIDWLNENVK